jgi:hypothetical protein
MAASDKPFNNQRTLDIVFAVSNILMLLSVVWMFVQDYNREYKTELRIFRRIEVGIAQRQALESLPDPTDFTKAESLVNDLKKKRESEENTKILNDAQASLLKLQPQKQRAEAAYQTVKADVESFTSLLYIAIEHGDNETRNKYEGLLKDRNAKLIDAQSVRDDIDNQMKAQRLKIDEIDGKLTKAIA